MTLDLYELIDLGTELLNWQPATPDGQERMAADLRLLAETQALTAGEGAALGTLERLGRRAGDLSGDLPRPPIPEKSVGATGFEPAT
jgi:hypothetical protein